MVQNISISSEYFQKYRQKLGFGSQSSIKNFFGAKDITPKINLDYLKLLNQRLYEIIEKLNAVVVDEVKVDNLEKFKERYIDHPFEIMRKNKILPVLNNLGRRPEQVYFSWMRGYVISNFFSKALGCIFEINLENIKLIGDDDLKNIETFRRTPKADLEVTLKNGEKIRIEMQAGFTGINNIKQHKVLEAKRVFRDEKVHSLAMHFDLYNGQVAFVKLDEIQDSDVNWITRQQMEGQTVFNINQNHFVWKITESPIKYCEIGFD